MEKIGGISPHTICYPAIVNSGLLSTSKNINDESLYDYDSILNYDIQNKNIANLSSQTDV